MQLVKVFQTELRKSYKSKVIWITFFAFTLLPMMGGFFMFILKDPDFAKKAGLLGTKAQLAGSADWPSYFLLLSQGLAVGGLFVFGFITSWVFGREYTDHTVKDLLALPFPRVYMPIAKFATVIVWGLAVSIWVIGLSFVAGGLLDLPLWSSNVWQEGLWSMSVSAVLTILLSSPVAFFACYGRGYLAPLGFVILTLILSQIIAAIGYGEYFPWAIPALFSHAAGADFHIGAVSVLIVLLTSIVGFGATLYYWRFADHH